MDLRVALLQLIAPLTIGDDVGDGFVLLEASTALGPRLRLGCGTDEVIVELVPLAQGLPHAVATADYGLSYRSGAVDSATGQAVCRSIAQRVRDNEARVRADTPRASDEPRVREVTVTRALEPMGSYAALSPYVGCVIGCRFCYAQSRLGGARRMIGLPQVPWGSWVDVRINAAEVLARELAAGAALPIKFCPIVSDPYQAVEQRYRITRACLQALVAADAPPPTMLLTRSSLVLDDLPLLARLPRAWVGVSLPTLDEDALRHFEPRAASVAERLAILQRARTLGLSTIAVVQPILPGPVDALADALTRTADSVRVAVLDGEEGAAGDFDDPRYAEARADRWQREHARALADALTRRGVSLWRGELPPELQDAMT